MAEKLNKQEFSVLWQLEEGGYFPEDITPFTGLDESKVQQILVKLEKIGLVAIEKKYDEYYKKENWSLKLNKEKAKEYYETYRSWIPKLK